MTIAPLSPDSTVAEVQQSLLDRLAESHERQTHPSVAMVEDLIATFKAFQGGLTDVQDMVVHFPSLQQAMSIRSVRRRGPHLLEFTGELDGGDLAQAIMHCHHIAFVVKAVPKLNETALRIDFDMAGCRLA